MAPPPKRGVSLAGVLGFAAKSFVEAEQEDGATEVASLDGAEQQAEAIAVARTREALRQEDGQLVPDAFLRKCLVFQRWDVHAAVGTAAGFLRFRRSAGWPLRIPSSAVEKALRTGFHWLLRPQGPRELQPRDWAGTGEPGPAACLVFTMARLDPRVGSVEDYQKMSTFLMEHATDDPATQRQGIAVVVDFRGVQLTRLSSILGMEDIRRGVSLWRGAFPCRLRRIWLLDPPAGIHFLASGVLRLLSPKVRDRIRIAVGKPGLARIAEDLEPLVELPQCLGGRGELRWAEALAAMLAREPASEEDEAEPTPEGAGLVSEGRRPVGGSTPAASKPCPAWAVEACCVSRGYFR